MARSERNHIAGESSLGGLGGAANMWRSLAGVSLIAVALFGMAFATVRLGTADRILPADQELAATGQRFVATTDDGWAVLGDDWIQFAVDGQWNDPIPIDVTGAEFLEDPDAYVLRHQFVATDDGFAFVALHRFSSGDGDDRTATAYRFVSSDGVSWSLDPEMTPIESLDALGISAHTDDGFAVIRRAARPGGGTSQIIDFYTAGTLDLTVEEGAASALGPATRATDGSVAFAEQVFVAGTSSPGCVNVSNPQRGSVSALNVWTPGATDPLTVPFPCSWQEWNRWIGEGAVSIGDDRIHVASSLGLWVLSVDGTTLDVIAWEESYPHQPTLRFTPDGTRVVRVGGDHPDGPLTIAVYDIATGEWTDLLEWPDSSTLLLQLIDDDAIFFLDVRDRMLRSVALR